MAQTAINRYPPNPMSDEPVVSSSDPSGDAEAILQWLVLAHGRGGTPDADQLHRQLIRLRDTPIPTSQRLKLLELLFAHVDRLAHALFPDLHEISLPVSRRLRQRVRSTQDVLEAIAQEYFNTLAELFDPLSRTPASPPLDSLRRVMQCISWHIEISHLVAAPTGIGQWQQLHAAYRSARKLGLVTTRLHEGEKNLQSIYLCVLLTAIAQPASFSSRELEFISELASQYVDLVTPQEAPPDKTDGVFWIDLEKDFPAHALIRRIPSADSEVLYFACNRLAERVELDLLALKNGQTAAALGLPAFAEGTAGRGVLQRLQRLWGEPARRRFPRRRQSYRARLCSGLEDLWHLIRNPEESRTKISEWMVTNESPDGYAMMHMSGQTDHLRVGDIVAIQAIAEQSGKQSAWHICLIRWALSENPEHIELGLQLLASRAIAAHVIKPKELEAGSITALILPESLPLRASQALIVPSGMVDESTRKLVVVLDQENLAIREIKPTGLDERTTRIEIFSFAADETA
jgi:hypothetical protein